MKKLNDLQKLTFEFDEIESIEDVGYQECVDIEVEDDHSFTLSNKLISHNSAKQGLSDGLGRAEIGYFSTRGVPLNAYEVAPQKIAANEELENIIKCLKLHLKEETQSELTYEKIVLANDSDADGSHIMSLYIAFFSKYAPSIIKEKRLCALKLPLICMKDSKGNIIEMFRSFDEYNNWVKENKNSKLECKYYKGLGSWKDKEIKALIAKHGIDKFIEPLELDKESLKLIL